MMDSDYKKTVDDTIGEYLDEGLVPDTLEDRIETLLDEGDVDQALELLRKYRKGSNDETNL
jgi:hypothetical protein